MTVELATVRASIAGKLSALGVAETYRRRQKNFQFPAFVVGWPESLDFRPAMADARDFVIDVYVGVESVEDDSSDDLLSDLLESASVALAAEPGWDVRPATDFGEELMADSRTIIWCRLPVMVLA